MDEARAPLRILMTNNMLATRAGSELYLRDLAVALMNRGHLPVAYSPELGEVADELRARTIPVIDDLRQMTIAPDVIHGQHHHETMTAALRYPQVPVVYACHGWAPWEELPPAYPTVMHHVAVDDLCRERLLTTHGTPPERITTLYNFVDLQKFAKVRDLPERPRSALVFSNYASGVSDMIRSACAKCGIERVDIVGRGSGNEVARPEEILGEYDVVFAKARAAIEAMASGCAVIVTDYAGLAGMVTSDTLARLRGLNFGVRSMQASPLTSEAVERELQRYDAGDARRVTETIRRDADLEPAADRWVAIYRQAMADWAADGGSVSDADRLEAASQYLRFLAPRVKYGWRFEARSNALEAERDALTQALEECRARAEAANTPVDAKTPGIGAFARFFQR